jgi:NADH:ubiquinone oxidoreductase subunit 5 (subunit L)/multisubunit Na+/H+ antiporter MnhA subunit
VAQLGYLFIVFPLAGGGDPPPWQTIAWTGGVLQLVSHALAKAALFMAAGVIAAGIGHDRIDGLAGFGRLLPVTAATILLAGLSLMGLPPSGGFIAKCLLLTAAALNGHPFLAATVLAGGLLAAGYVFRLLGVALAAPSPAIVLLRPIPLRLELVPLVLALLAVLIGFLPLEPSGLLQIGRPDLAAGGAP